MCMYHLLSGGVYDLAGILCTYRNALRSFVLADIMCLYRDTLRCAVNRTACVCTMLFSKHHVYTPCCFAVVSM